MKERMPDNLMDADEGTPKPTKFMESPEFTKEQ